jgi:putative transposase
MGLARGGQPRTASITCPSRRAATRFDVIHLTDERWPAKYPFNMADTYTKITVHCVFSTKNRLPLVTEPEHLWIYLRGIARNRGVDTLAIGGTANHVHKLIALSRRVTLSDLMRDLKANSSRHMNEKHRGFAWQDGYAAISVSPSQIDNVTRLRCRKRITPNGVSRASTRRS